MGASSSHSSSRPVDLTPNAFSNLQQPFANVLAGLLGFSPTAQPNTTTTGQTPNVPTSVQTSTGYINGNHDYGGTNINGGSHGGSSSAGGGTSINDLINRNQQQQQPQTQPPAQTTPTYTAGNGDPLSGIPTYQGPLTTEITGNEQSILDQLMQYTGNGQSSTTPNPQSSQVQQYLQSIIGGSQLPGNMTPQQVNDFVSQLNLGYDPNANGSLSDFTQQYSDAMGNVTNNYDFDQQNPFLQAAIEAAQRPTQQALEETLSRTLPGRFTQAGQFVQPQGSSAFDRAAALATRGASDSLADIATNMSYQAYDANAQRQFEAQQATQAQQAEAAAQELERRGQFEEAARTRQAAATESELNRNAQQQEAERQRQQEAALAQPGVSSQEINNLLANLQAQALPRTIQDLGIERGLEQFNNQVNALLSTLGITAGVTRPVVGNTSSSSSGGVQLK